MRYYRLTDAVATRGRWFLASPLSPAGEELDPRLFTNVTRAVHCLDETASDILWWTAEDDRPATIPMRAGHS